MKLPWKHCQLRLTRAGHAIERAGWHLDRQWFARCLVDYDFWFIVRGKGTFSTTEGQTYSLDSGSCIWMRKSATYDYRVADDSEIEMYFFHFDLLDARGKSLPPSRLKLPPLLYETFNPQFFIVLCQHIYRLFHAEATLQFCTRADLLDEAVSLVRALLLEYENEAGRQAHILNNGIDLHYQKVVTHALALLDENPKEILSTSQLAKSVGYSTDHFSKIFKQITNRSPQEMIIHRRIKLAKSMLQLSAYPIHAIAETLGYQSPFYFTRQFTKEVGMSPLAFRKHQIQGNGS